MGKEERDKGQDVETQVLEKGYTHYLYAKQRRICTVPASRANNITMRISRLLPTAAGCSGSQGRCFHIFSVWILAYSSDIVLKLPMRLTLMIKAIFTGAALFQDH